MKTIKNNVSIYSFQLIHPSGSDWDLIEAAYDTTVFHCRKWNDYVVQTGYKPFVVEIRDSNGLIGHFIASQRKLVFKIVMAPPMGIGTYSGGLCTQAPISKRLRIDIYIQLVEWLYKSKLADYIQICDWQLKTVVDKLSDNWHDPDLDVLGIHYSGRPTFFLDINKNIDDLWSQLHYKSCKYCINKARKKGLCAEIVTNEDEIEAFVDQHYSHIQAMLSRKKSRGLPCQRRKNISALCHALFPDRIAMVQVVGEDDNGKTVSMASGIFANGKAGCTFFTGASYKEYLDKSPNEPMVWEGICEMNKRGSGDLIFGGVADYKKKFGCVYAVVPVMVFTRFSVLLKSRIIIKKGYTLLSSMVWKLKHLI